MAVSESKIETPSDSLQPLSDLDILLSYSIHFTWGYPDYLRQAFKVLQDLSCEYVPMDPHKELTWKQLRQAIETADSLSVRCLVAGHGQTPINVLDYLARGKDEDVSRRVAENPNSHAATLARLSRHAAVAVRMAVSENTNTAEGVLLHLTSDTNPDLRYIMAENANMPRTVLEVLSTDENPYVRERAMRSLNVTKVEVLVADFSRVARRRIDRAAY
jgi:hypothetical protein